MRNPSTGLRVPVVGTFQVRPVALASVGPVGPRYGNREATVRQKQIKEELIPEEAGNPVSVAEKVVPPAGFDPADASKDRDRSGDWEACWPSGGAPLGCLSNELLQD
jgi:hypothetical protein